MEIFSRFHFVLKLKSSSHRQGPVYEFLESNNGKPGKTSFYDPVPALDPFIGDAAACQSPQSADGRPVTVSVPSSAHGIANCGAEVIRVPGQAPRNQLKIIDLMDRGHSIEFGV